MELFAGEAFRRAFLLDIEERLTQAEDTILSLDVFDTLVLRNDKSEITRLWEISARVAEALSGVGERRVEPVDVLAQRYTATVASYRMSTPVEGCREGSIDEIWGLATRQLVPGKDSLAAVVDIELAYEAENLTPHSILVPLVASHISRGGRVVLISDMYLHARHIRALLRKLDIDDGQFAGVFSSADTKVSKRSGAIFRVVERHLGAPPTSFLHAGDSLFGDFRQARRRGWQSVHLPMARGERERRLDDDRKTRMHLKNEFGLAFPLIARPE